MQPAPASQPPPCLPASGSAVRHNSTVKVRCMLKRHGLIYPETPALLEALRTHLCTQLFQATTAQLNRQFTIGSREWGAGSHESKIPRIQPPPPTKEQTSKKRPGGQRSVFCSHSSLSSCVVSFPPLTCWDELGFFSQLRLQMPGPLSHGQHP